MQIRKLSENERQDALNLITEVFFRKTGNVFAVPQGKKPEDTGLEYLGLYDGTLNAVLVYDPETMHVSGVSVREKEEEKEDTVLLLNELKKEAVSAGFDRISASPSADSLAYYQAAGFTADTDSCDCFLASEILGRKVTVTIEHYTGELHGIFPDEQYGCCTGYVEELAAAGQFANAYIISDEIPQDTFSGTVIAVVYRRDGSSVWIVSGSETYDKADVISRIAFSEQYYETTIRWL